MGGQGTGASHLPDVPRTEYLRWIFGFILAGFFLIGLWVVAADTNGRTSDTKSVWDTQLVWHMSWLAATVVVVLAILWRLTKPPPRKDVDVIREDLDNLEQIRQLVQSRVTGIKSTALESANVPPNPGQQETAVAQVLATLISAQDHTTWLAFTLGMTSEVVLITGFIQAASSHFNWLVALGGVLLAGAFWNMVIRSNADMGALYKKGECVSRRIFHLPNHLRRGISAGLVMNIAFGGWIIAWLAALAFVLNPII